MVPAKPGMGKSMTAHGIAQSYSGATLYQCHFGLSPFSLIKAILAIHDIKCNSLSDGMAKLAKLASTSHLDYLIIDEADLLPIGALEALRWLQDVSQIYLILLGEERLKGVLKSEPRLNDRSTYCSMPKPNLLDAKMLANSIAGQMISDDLINWIYKQEGHNLRTLAAALNYVHKHGGGQLQNCATWDKKPLIQELAA